MQAQNSMARYVSANSVQQSAKVFEDLTTGNVGVGSFTTTAPPLQPFHVLGSARFDVTGTGDGPGRFHFNRPAGNYENFLSLETAGSYKWLLGMDNSESNDNLHVFNSAATNVLTISQTTGHIGIGTPLNVTPLTRLQVQGQAIWTTHGNNLALPSAAGKGLRMHYDVSTSTGHVLAYDYGAAAANNLALQATGGNVGIGTVTPLARLQVGGTYERAAVSGVGGNTQYWTSYLGLNLVRDYSTGNWTTVSDGANNGGSAIISDLGGNMSFYVFRANSLAQPMSDAAVAGMMSMRIRNTGRVVIGPKELNSGSPYENDLTLPTRLSVDGRIVAKEVVVSVTDFWPDYVFADNYKLMSLENLESYIAANRHLPGFRPAAEMEQNGIQLSETVKAQMEKIEELTLYIIEQNKQIEALKQRMDAAEQR